MPAASSRLLIGWFHLAVVVAIVGFSVAAVRHRPPTRLIGQAKVNAGTTLTLRDGSGGYPGSSSRPDVRPTLGQDPDPLTATAAKNRLTAGHRSWDMDLRLDDTIRPPGWPWTLHEGKNQGEGYELHWLPERLVLQVQRSRPRTAPLAGASPGGSGCHPIPHAV